jgi:hypothetical protein
MPTETTAQPDAPEPARRPFTVRRGLRYALVAQVAVAGLVLLVDLGDRLPTSLGGGTTNPLTSPVVPGDQVRRHEPNRARPTFTGPSEAPTITLPEDLPPRLSFTVQTEDTQGALIVATGPIEPGDADRFDAFLDGLAELPGQVALHSPGGDVDEALEIGRRLRARDLSTTILPGTICLSACPYILAAGVERVVSLRGSVGLHQHYYETPGYMPAFLAVEDIQRSQGRTMEYLIEMGIDPGVMRFGLSTAPEDIYVLVEAELIDSRMATTTLP